MHFALVVNGSLGASAMSDGLIIFKWSESCRLSVMVGSTQAALSGACKRTLPQQHVWRQ